MHTSLPSPFHALHAPGRLLLLPNAWDAASARVMEACGAAAVATSSASVSWAHGVPDGERLDAEQVLWTARSVCRAVRVPVTVDLEAGYGDALETLVQRLVELGVSGINLEDGGGPPEVLAQRIRVARAAADRAGAPLFVNARTDVYLRGLGAPDTRVAETLARARRYRDAGCDGLFVPGLAQEAELEAVARGVDLPLNVMTVPGLPGAARLQALGVRRLSLGPAPALAALGTVRRVCSAFLAGGEAAPEPGALTYPEMNALLAPRPVQGGR